MTRLLFALVDAALLIRADVAVTLDSVEGLDAYERAKRERRLRAAAMTWAWWRSTWVKQGVDSFR